MDYPERSTGRDAPLFLMRTWSGSYVEPGRWHRAAIGWCRADPANVFLIVSLFLTVVTFAIPLIHLLVFGSSCS